jgi:hypothetical protein
MSNHPPHRVHLGYLTANFAHLSNMDLASAASPIAPVAPILLPSFLFSELKAVKLSRLTHIGQPIQHVMTLLPPSARGKQSPVNAPPAGGASANKPNAALPKPTLTLVQFVPRRLSEEFVECMRVMAESIIKESPAQTVLNDHRPEMLTTSIVSFYQSPHFVKLLRTYDKRICTNSEWFALLDDCQDLLNPEVLPERYPLPVLTAQIHTERVKPRARRALRELAEAQGTDKEALLRQWLAPEGLLLASGESDLRQRIRFGRQWLKDQLRKVTDVRPNALPFYWFVCWLVQRAHRHVEDRLLDRAVDGQRSDLLETNRVDFRGFATEIVDRHPEAGVFAPSPEAIVEAQTLMAALASVASPRERELPFLLLDGVSPQEAAAQLGITGHGGLPAVAGPPL